MPKDEMTAEGAVDPRVALRRTLECLVGAAFTEGNAITVLRNGDEIFPAMLDAIRGAEHSVDLMTFVYWKGWPAREFAEALEDRARAGLRVRVLIDALGGRLIEDGLVDAMKDAGVDVHWFRKPLHKSPFKQNHRGHRKLLVVDEVIGFTGGVGIAEEWGGDARDEREWRDTHFRVEGPAVDGLAAAFVQDWAETGRPLYDERSRFPAQPTPGDAIVQVVRGSASIGWDDIHTVWYVLIRSAQERIRLQTAYFSPDSALVRALKEAVERGVQVDVLLPGPHADKRVTQLASEATYAEVEDAGVQIWNFQPSMMHAKVMVVDGAAALVGSSNVNRRSLDHDEEVAMVVIDQPTVDLLEQHFLEDLERSRRIELTRWEDRRLRQRLLERAVRPIRRWL
ncbi:phospholipase D-like domain-containing protein [Intrasporangium calvum]|uniref:Phospholipase D-like domain-containing protein n=1 Tax=Intrasporangium calvum TaxID=53358 RepID=A0ABT5GG30_9MICO|nr:phospholipase D-like domain-containing protein [Intrasporangium calvum]MDC5697199.1 phospholipase D-like domain-containing protein [Intrasporangium calvum]